MVLGYMRMLFFVGNKHRSIGVMEYQGGNLLSNGLGEKLFVLYLKYLCKFEIVSKIGLKILKI